MKYFAAIDIGSNALRLAVAKPTREGFHISLKLREPVRLGSDVFSGGALSEQTFTDLKNALLLFKNQLENYKVSGYRAIATSAMRDATNSQDIVERLFRQTGIQIEVISGQEEAQLVFSAISQKIEMDPAPRLLIDIGGGSIELVATEGTSILKKESFPLGTVRTMALHEERMAVKKSSKPLADWYARHLQEELSPFFEDLPNLKTAIGTGGNMDRFAKIKELEALAPTDGLSLSEISKLSKAVQAYSLAERVENFHIRWDRADVIEPAIIATHAIMKLGGCQCLRIPLVGIKEGLLGQLMDAETTKNNS